MEESRRDCLKKDSSIMLSRNADGSSPKEYFIRSVIGEGGSAVCYEAMRKLEGGGMETGKLKEFYPIDLIPGYQARYYSLERLPDGQLVPGEGVIRKFEEMCQDYLHTYKLLKKVMADNPENEILKSYIQDGEILYGCIIDRQKHGNPERLDEILKEKSPHGDRYERKPTVYIWSSGIAGKKFDDYLKEVRKNPMNQPEQRLRDILCVIDTMTDCIKALHTAGLIHMDIKPSNFLLQYDSDFEIKPNHISLFDINTLCSVESEVEVKFKSEGYCAPEVTEKKKADNRSDIYSIGAMLFNAVVITTDISDGLYRDSYYPRISQLVKHSELFEASETNSDAVLMSKICRILEKCLARNPRERYQSCSELKEDLKAAKNQLEKVRWISSAEKKKQGLTDPTIVMQKLLYEHPLYEAIDDLIEVKDINVLVIGSGTYSQRFMDICLQSGQMSQIRLNITAVSDDPQEEKESYLRFRPGLREFVNIDGSLNGKEESAYANLEFQDISQMQEGEDGGIRFCRNARINQQIIKNIIENAARNQREYHYVFVSLENDSITQPVARLCSEELCKSRGYVRPVCYVSQKSKKERRRDAAAKCYPVCVNETVDLEMIHHDLGEMAFNTHISWNSKMNLDITKERKEFFSSEKEENRYNRRSSLAYVLSAKYKLRSIFDPCDCDNLIEMADLFSSEILDRLDRRSSDENAKKNAKKKFDQLVNLEHRRWVLEKVCDGWTAPRDDKGNLKLEDCIVRGSVKDMANRTHPCLVRSSATSPLHDPLYAADHHAKWNEGSIDAELDELDRMSIELHRCFKRQADIFKKDSLLQNADLIFIQNIISPENEVTLRAFKQFQFALKNIVNGVECYSRQYDYYQDALKNTLHELPDEIRTEIEERLKAVKRVFFPVVESNLYRNYKAKDEVLIKKLPFILTYRYQAAVAMAFEDGKYQNGRNEAVFGNVAAATVLRPEKIHFFYCYEKDSDVELLIRKIAAVINYLGKRNIHCGIHMIVACLKEVPDKVRERLQEELGKLEKAYLREGEYAWLETAEIFPADNYAEAANQFAEYLRENPADLYDGGNQLFSSGYDNAFFIKQITEQQIPYFEFDWRNKKFTKWIECEYLKFVKDSSFIRVNDMFALMNATDRRFHLPEFADDYEILWKIYTGEYSTAEKFENGVENWNYLCTCLQKYEADQKPLVNMAVSTKANPRYKTLIYFLPEYSFSTAKMILQRLIECGIAEKESTLYNYASDTCKLELRINAEYEEQMNIVFNNPQILLSYYKIEVRKYKSYNADYIEIRYNSLTVTDVDLDPDGTGRDSLAFKVLRQLEEAHFISQLKKDPADPKRASFVYSSARIKHLLTCAAEILEIYAYYDVLKTGYFDDVASGYEFYWESGEVKNKLDLIVTKGFKSIMAECKSVSELSLEYYHKLHIIADQFGIGTMKVLIGNTYHDSDEAVNDKNDMQRSRGLQLNIKTISSEEKIIHIGQTLKDLMEAEG